jgi:hypothetical protein
MGKKKPAFGLQRGALFETNSVGKKSPRLDYDAAHCLNVGVHFRS